LNFFDYSNIRTPSFPSLIFFSDKRTAKEKYWLRGREIASWKRAEFSRIREFERYPFNQQFPTVTSLWKKNNKKGVIFKYFSYVV